MEVSTKPNIIRRIARGVLFSVLRGLAKTTLNKYSPTVIGITGSVGKTTAKELVAHVLASKYKVAKSPQNANTEWGVVATLINPHFRPTLSRDEKGMVTLGQALSLLFKGIGQLFVVTNYPQILVLELAVDRPRDMKLFNRLLKLDMAVITNIGQTHLKYFPSQDALIDEKWSITKGLKASGILVANGDNEFIARKALIYKGEKLLYGWGETNDFYAKARVEQGAKLTTTFYTPTGELEADLPLGRQLVLGAIPAVIAAQRYGMDGAEIVQALNTFKSLAGRFEVYKLSHGLTLINDAYNANPDSMRSAILSMQDMARGRTVAILGGMAELGEAHLSAHQSIGEFIGGRVDVAIFVGEDGQLMAKSALGSRTEIVVMPEVKLDEIIALLRDNDTVLVKASRVHGLDKVAEAIKMEFK